MYFTIEDSINYPEEKQIRMTEKVHKTINTSIDGSYGILYCRLFGLSYVDFYRFVRDKYCANIHRGKKYLCFTFSCENDAKVFKDELEKRWNRIVF